MDMYKVVWVARYANGMSKQEASDYWAGHHGPLMKAVSPVAGYVQSHAQGPLPAVSGVAEEKTLFDGYSSAWWKDRADFQQAMSTPAWQAVVDDGDNVFDMQWLWNMSARIEEVVRGRRPVRPYKVVWVMKFLEGMDKGAGPRPLAPRPRPDLPRAADRALRAEPRRRADRRRRRPRRRDRLRRLLGVLVQRRGAVPRRRGVRGLGGARSQTSRTSSTGRRCGARRCARTWSSRPHSTAKQCGERVSPVCSMIGCSY